MVGLPTTAMGQNEQQWGPMHEIVVPCTCPDITQCSLERYIADVRILEAEVRVLRATVGRERESATRGGIHA